MKTPNTDRGNLSTSYDTVHFTQNRSSALSKPNELPINAKAPYLDLGCRLPNGMLCIQEARLQEEPSLPSPTRARHIRTCSHLPAVAQRSLRCGGPTPGTQHLTSNKHTPGRR
ncbi:unnamed protein product [Ectocarpus sp. 8 AP-2014]